MRVEVDDAQLAQIVQTGAITALQLHGKESPERSAAIRQRFSLPVWKAISVKTRSDIDAAAVADMLAGLFWGAGFHAGFLRGRTADDDAGGVARQLLTLFESGLLESPVAAPVDA